MGTNYRWHVALPLLPNGEPVPLEWDHPTIHIGKLSYTGNDTARFSWAQEPGAVLDICERRPDESLIVDEYGDALTGAEFLALARDATWDTHYVGRVFC